MDMQALGRNALTSTCVAALTAFATPVSAADWLGGSADWNTAANWLPAAVPGAGTDIVINGSPAFAPVIDGFAANGRNLKVGATPGPITLTVRNGGSLTTSDSMIGNAAGERGIILVDASTLTATNLEAGFNGNGTLRLTNGASAVIGSSLAGVFAGSEGHIEVTGPSTSWTTTSVSVVGDGGVGTFILSGKAKANDRSLAVGQAATGNGSALATGQGTLWNVTGSIVVASRGRGLLEIRDGARMETAALGYVGHYAGSNGELRVSGGGSSFKTVSFVTIGHEGTGKVLVEDGATVDTKQGIVGREVGSNGTVRITGEGTTWLGTVYLMAAHLGKAEITVDSGATVRIDNGAGMISIANGAGSQGTFNIGAGQTEAARGAGFLDVAEIRFGPGAGTLVLNHTDAAYALGARITRNGTIRHLAGNTSFNGDSSTFAGNTQVTGGRLSVDGKLGGTLNVSGSGILGGTGAVGSLSIGAGGTLAPGNSVGSLTVTGNLAFAPGSTYEVEISAAGADRTNVGGAATLTGGTVTTTVAPGTQIQRQYVILNATGGLGGTRFASVGAPAGFGAELAYDANNVYLNLSLLLAGASGLTTNQQSVANAINSYFNTNGTIPAGFAALSPTGLTSVTGEAATGSLSSGVQAADQFLGLISDPHLQGGAPAGAGNTIAGYDEDATTTRGTTDAAYAALLGKAGAHGAVDRVFATRWAIWGAAYGGSERSGGNATIGAQDYSGRSWGIASGAEHRLGDSRIGFAFGGGGSGFSLANGLGGGSSGSFGAGLYGSHNFGDAYLSGALAYGWHNSRTERSVGGDTLTGRFNAHSLSARAEAGYRIGVGATGFTPYGALQAISYRLPAYAESATGAGTFAIAYGRQSKTAARTELGLRLDHDLAMGDTVARLSGRAAWAINAGSTRSVSGAFQALPGQAFTITGATPDRHAMLVEAGAEFTFASGLAAKLSFDGEFSRNVRSYGARARLSYAW